MVNFKVEFTKPSEMYIGSIKHVIGTYNSFGQFKQLIQPEDLFLAAVTNSGFQEFGKKHYMLVIILMMKMEII